MTDQSSTFTIPLCVLFLLCGKVGDASLSFGGYLGGKNKFPYVKQSAQEENCMEDPIAGFFQNSENIRHFSSSTTRREYDIARVLFFGRLFRHIDGIVDDLTIA